MPVSDSASDDLPLQQALAGRSGTQKGSNRSRFGPFRQFAAATVERGERAREDELNGLVDVTDDRLRRPAVRLGENRLGGKDPRPGIRVAFAPTASSPSRSAAQTSSNSSSTRSRSRSRTDLPCSRRTSPDLMPPLRPFSTGSRPCPKRGDATGSWVVSVSLIRTGYPRLGECFDLGWSPRAPRRGESPVSRGRGPGS